MSLVGTLSFQVPQLIRSGKDMLVSSDTTQWFLAKIGERYSFKKKSDSQHENPISTEWSVNEVMEIVLGGKNVPSTRTHLEDGLMELFDQLPGLASPMSDWVELETTIVISEASLQGKSAIYQVTIQNL